MRRRVLGRFLIFVVLALSAWIVFSSETFRGCVDSEKNQPSQHHAVKGIPKPRSTLALYKFCNGEFMNKNGEAVTAFFTIVLAVSTIGLWFATNRLYEAGERQMELIDKNALQQASDNKQFIAAATDSANAAISANQITVTNSEQQLRAYVTATGINMITHREPGRMSPYGNVVLDDRIHSYRFAAILLSLCRYIAKWRPNSCDQCSYQYKLPSGADTTA